MRGAIFAELATFAAVARLKSFRLASAELNLSTSATSHSLRALEQRLGVKLLNRTTRSVSLTDAGLQLLHRISPAFADIENSISEVKTSAGRLAGIVRLNMPREAAHVVIAPILGRFGAAYPDIQLEVVIDEELVDIVAGGYDAGIRLHESLQLDMVSVSVSPPLRGVVVGSPAYFASHPRPVHPRDLGAHRCLNYRLSYGGKILKWEFTRAGETAVVAEPGPLLTNDPELQIAGALQGLGLACLTECTVAHYLATGQLETVLDDWCQPFAGWCLYYPKARVMTPSLRAFVDFMRAPLEVVANPVHIAPSCA
jgi:DNA-binding transcriptional LysR family regulator